MSTQTNDYFSEQLLAVDRPVSTREGEDGRLWRMDEPTMAPGSTDVVTGGMWPHQRAWWELPNFIRLLVGGYGSGKSMCLCKRVIASALENAPCPVAIVSPTFPMARRTTIPTIAGLLAGKRSILGPKFVWSYNHSSHEFRVWWRGRKALIAVYSGEKPLSLRGPNLASAYIDEPFIQDYEVFRQIQVRVRHPEARFREIGIGGTPEQLNWGYDLCEGELRSKFDVGVIHASSHANRALPHDYLKQLEAAFDDKAGEAYIHGRFIDLSTGLVYYAFSRERNVVDLKKPEQAQLGVGLDFNVDPMAAVVFWRTPDHIHVVEEFEFPNADTEYVCQVLRERYWEQGLREFYPDPSGHARSTKAPSGKSDFTYIRSSGFEVNARRVNPRRRDRYNAANAAFKSSQTSGVPTVTVSPGCKRIVKYLLTYSHERMRKQARLSHLLDALTYPIEYLFPAHKPELKETKLIGA